MQRSEGTAATLDEPRYLEAALRAAEFVRARFKRPDGSLWHRFREEAGIEGHLDDYAFLIYGFLKLHEASLENSWLEEAKGLTRA